MTIRQAAKALHVSKPTIINWLRNDWLERDGAGVSDNSVAREFGNTPVLILFRRISKISQLEMAAMLGVSEWQMYLREKASLRFWQMTA